MLNKLFVFFILCFFLNILFANDEKSITKTPLVIAEKISIHSEVYSDRRDFYVSVPTNYSQVSKKYPLLFILDGDHFIRMADLASKDLSASHRIEEMIVVAISQKNRREELKMPGASKFSTFIQAEVIPYIKENYRSTNFYSIYGHSLGGSFVLNTLMNNDQFFTNYIAISPVLDIDGTAKIDDLKRFFNKKSLPKKYLYLAKGNEKDQYQKTIPVLINTINQNKPDWLRFTHQDFPQHTHATVALPSMFAALTYLFDGWIMPKLGNLNAFKSIEQINNIGGFEKVKDYYLGYSSKLGFEFAVPSIVYSRFAWIYYNAKDHEDLLDLVSNEGKDREEVNYYLAQSYLYSKNYNLAVSLMQEDLKLNPNHTRGWYTLSLAHRELDQNEKAKIALLKAIELAKATDSDQLNKYETMLHTLKLVQNIEE